LKTRRDIALAIFALCYGVWFFRMTRYGLHSWFSEDDLLNIYYCWSKPFSDLLRGNIVFFNHYNRPMGELLLYVLYSAFGFNPGPFNIVRMILCFASLVVLYRFAERLTGSREMAVLSVMLIGVHPVLNSIYFDSGMYFDLLAFLFYYASMTLYIEGRRTVWAAVLFLCALNSKEIAVSLPVALLLLRRYRPAMITGLLTLIYIVGKNTGARPLSANAAYHPQFSPGLYLDNYAHYLAQLTFLTDAAVRPFVAFILIGCVILALLMRNRVMIGISLFNLVSILPIAFIPPRNGFAFFISAAGWAIYLSIMLAEGRQFVICRNRNLRLPAQAALAAALVFLVLRPEYRIMNRDYYPLIHSDQYRNRDAWTSLHAALPPRLTGKRILGLHDPFDLGYALYFMIQLGYADPTIQVDTVRLLNEHKQPVLARQYDYVIDYSGRAFFVVPGPPS
jgi:hypothetical protein